MTTKQLSKFFDAHEDDFLKFEEIPAERRLSQRPDLNAFMLLDKIVPGDDDMVSCAEHDEIWLKVEPADLGHCATKEQLLDLIRCGLRYDSDTDSLAMFV
jgi:hypothetical protein